MKSSLLGWVFAFGLTALGVTGCYRASQSEIAQGRTYRSGQADYDRFFDATHALQVKVGAARAELVDARQNLTSAVTVAQDTNSAVLALRIKTELDRVARSGTSVRIEFVSPPPPSLEPSATKMVLTPTSKPRAPDAILIRQVENSVTRLLRLDASMKISRQELNALATTAVELEASLDRVFPLGSAGRDNAVVNLHDAERAITLMVGNADEAQKPTADFLGKLAVALGSPWRAPGIPDSTSEQRVVRAGKSTEPTRSAAETPRASGPGSSSAGPVTRAEFEP